MYSKPKYVIINSEDPDSPQRPAGQGLCRSCSTVTFGRAFLPAKSHGDGLLCIVIVERKRYSMKHTAYSSHPLTHSAVRALAALLGASCLLTLAACGGNKLDRGESSSGGSSSATVSTGGTTSAATPGTESPAANRNPLTGVADITPGSSTRPVAVMVENSSTARPQYGLDKADLFLEAETEGGITRIMAVFAGPSRIPAMLGPLRSARSPFVTVAQSLDAVYCHAGGSTLGLANIQKFGLDDVNFLSNAAQAGWRDKGLKSQRGQEHSLVSSGEKIQSFIQSKGYSSSTGNPSPFTFDSPKAGNGPGSKVQLSFSGAQRVCFLYDEGTGLYKKMNGKLDNMEPHVMMDGTQLTAANVIIMYDEKYNEDDAHINFRLNAGSGVFLTKGTSRNIQWKRTAGSLSFTEEDGGVLSVNPGKTYICLVTKGNAGATILQ